MNGDDCLCYNASVDGERTASTIRELLSHLIGKRLLEITGEDEEDRAAGKDRFATLMFDDGNTVTFYFAQDQSAYRGNSPMSFSDPDDKSQSFEDGYFHPTPEEKERRGWIAVNWHDATGTETHVVPVWTKDHFLGESCWCQPIKKVREDESWFWGHNENTPTTR
jgi:hypothetical protein